MNTIKIPTGYLFTDTYSKGELETLSIGDYGRKYNVKANFLGYDREIHGVPNISVMPLSEKWVITLSTQYGCPMKCTFCDVPKIPFRGNATLDDLKQQFYTAISLFPSVTYTERLNIHLARMGEPILNYDVLLFAKWLYRDKYLIEQHTNTRIEVIHPVLSTSLPKNCTQLYDRIKEWCEIKNGIYNGQAGLQFSINSTNESQRDKMFSGLQTPLFEISYLSHDLPKPIGRKYCLNFAYASEFEIDAKQLRKLFNPSDFMVKITPIHNNTACRQNKIETVGGYNTYTPYRDIENDLLLEGFDVIVFIPSVDEEDSLVTCGNAVLKNGNNG